jgi:hypothetical protein
MLHLRTAPSLCARSAHLLNHVKPHLLPISHASPQKDFMWIQDILQSHIINLNVNHVSFAQNKLSHDKILACIMWNQPKTKYHMNRF